MTADTWNSRDLPVLDAVVDLADNDEWGHVNVRQIESSTGLSPATVQAALRALEPADPPLFTSNPGDGQILSVQDVTPTARRLVGGWPNPDAALVAVLTELAAKQANPEKKQALRMASDVVKEMPKTIVSAVVGAVTRGMLGG